MSADESFTHESLEDMRSIARYLEAVLEGLRQGKIQLEQNGDSVALHPHGLINFRVKAKKKGERSKLSLKLSWRERSDAADDGPLRVRPD